MTHSAQTSSLLSQHSFFSNQQWTRLKTSKLQWTSGITNDSRPDRLVGLLNETKRLYNERASCAVWKCERRGGWIKIVSRFEMKKFRNGWIYQKRYFSHPSVSFAILYLRLTNPFVFQPHGLLDSQRTITSFNKYSNRGEVKRSKVWSGTTWVHSCTLKTPKIRIIKLILRYYGLE